MSNLTSSLTTDKKFLIFGCGFSGSFFAKTIRQFGCTTLTSSRSEKKNPDSFPFHFIASTVLLLGSRCAPVGRSEKIYND